MTESESGLELELDLEELDLGIEVRCQSLEDEKKR